MYSKKKFITLIVSTGNGFSPNVPSTSLKGGITLSFKGATSNLERITRRTRAARQGTISEGEAFHYLPQRDGAGEKRLLMVVTRGIRKG